MSTVLELLKKKKEKKGKWLPKVRKTFPREKINL